MVPGEPEVEPEKETQRQERIDGDRRLCEPRNGALAGAAGASESSAGLLASATQYHAGHSPLSGAGEVITHTFVQCARTEPSLPADDDGQDGTETHRTMSLPNNSRISRVVLSGGFPFSDSATASLSRRAWTPHFR